MKWTAFADTVDGSEIRRSPVEVGSFSLYLQGFLYMPGGTRCLPSTVSPWVKMRTFDEK